MQPQKRNPAAGRAGRASELRFLAGRCSEDKQVPQDLQGISARVGVETRRITARAEGHLRDLEWRIARLGQLVDADEADRSLIVERIGVACELARLEAEAPR
jgi:hypothetical protein